MTTATTTDIVRIGAKIYAQNPDVIDLPAYVPIFHGWIQRKILDGVPIDVVSVGPDRVESIGLSSIF